MNKLWDHISVCIAQFEGYMTAKWLETKPFDMEEEVKGLQKSGKELKVDKKCNAYLGVMEEIKKWLVFLPLIAELRDESMRDRHWAALKKEIQKDFNLDDKLTLRDVFNLNLNSHAEAVEEITDQSKQEARMEKTLAKLDEVWKDVEFEFNKHKDSNVYLMKMNEEDFEQLEEHQTNVNAMFSSRFLSTFEEKCIYWQKSLALIAEVVQLLSDVQRTWSFLENLFIHSEEVKKELPKESDKFVGIDKEVKLILSEGKKIVKCIEYCNKSDIMPRLEDVQTQLSVCEKALNDFMDGKRRSFPRFYFVSTTDLLDILSNGNNPSRVMEHMPKIFQAIETLSLKEDGDRPLALGFESCVGVETVEFTKPLKLLGKVENYFADIIDSMRSSLKHIAGKSVERYGSQSKEVWLKEDPAQITLLINLVNWCVAVEGAFKKLASNAKAM